MVITAEILLPVEWIKHLLSGLAKPCQGYPNEKDLRAMLDNLFFPDFGPLFAARWLP